MTLEDFEKSLAEGQRTEEKAKSHHGHDGSKKHHRHHRHYENGEDRHRHKRRRHSQDGREGEHKSHRRRAESSVKYSDNDLSQGEGAATFSPAEGVAHTSRSNGRVQRDSWMEEPSALDIDYTQKGARKRSESTTSRPSKADFQLKIHENELNKHHLQDLADGKEVPEEVAEEAAQHEVDYHFGDSGAQWRMTKLKGVYRRAEETGRSIDDVAEEQFGDLRTFDNAREEQTELDRRATYGEGYVGKEKPSGELFEERKLDLGLRKGNQPTNNDQINDIPLAIETEAPAATTIPLDQTALNRLKAQMLKAKVRGSSDAAALEAEYNNAVAGFANRKQPDVVVLGAMDNRMLAGSREGEITTIDNKRGRERGLVEENEDMSIEDMVKQERRTRNQAGGDGQRFAERIAKDAKYDVGTECSKSPELAKIMQNDLDYMDENANKLAKRLQKSEINLKNTAITDFQKMNCILDNCPLCYHEDTDTPPVAPVVSLATRVYLTLPTEPEISDGGACIIPVQHRGNLLECDDDEWEEIRVGPYHSIRSLQSRSSFTELHEKPHAYVP